MQAWLSLPVRPQPGSMSSAKRSLWRRLSSGQNRDRHSTRPCFAGKSRRCRPCGRSTHSIMLRSALVRSAGSAGEHGISQTKWDGRTRMMPSTWLWPSYWIAAASRSMRACTGAPPGWVSSSPRPNSKSAERSAIFGCQDAHQLEPSTTFQSREWGLDRVRGWPLGTRACMRLGRRQSGQAQQTVRIGVGASCPGQGPPPPPVD